jgi:CBS domain-containing protein
LKKGFLGFWFEYLVFWRDRIVTIEGILKAKGSAVYTVAPEAMLEEAIGELSKHNVGALLVCERDPAFGEKVVGIITERDVLHVCASRKKLLTAMRVSDVMTVKLITATLADSLESAMGQMTTNRVRHLPVLNEGRLVGVVSIGDVVKAQHDRLAMENQAMKDYIQNQ